MFTIKLITLIVLLQLANCSKQCNDEFDLALLNAIKQNRDKIEPTTVDGYGPEFHYRTRLVNFTGRAKLDQITLSGLSTLRRSGNAVLINNRNGQSQLRAQLALGVVKINMASKLYLFGIGRTTQLTGRIAHVDVNITIKYNPETKETSLKQLEVNEVDGFSLSVDSKSRFDLTSRFINRVIKNLANSFQRLTMHAIESALFKTLHNSLKESKVFRMIFENKTCLL